MYCYFEVLLFRGNQISELDEDLIKEEYDEEKEIKSEQKRNKMNRSDAEIERIRQEQKLRLKKINARSDEDIWNGMQKRESKQEDEASEAPPTPNQTKHLHFNEKIEDVRFIEDEVNVNDENESDPEEPLRLKFRPLKPKANPCYSESKNDYITPWDIHRNYEIRMNERSKSILKAKDNRNKGNDLHPFVYFY